MNTNLLLSSILRGLKNFLQRYVKKVTQPCTTPRPPSDHFVDLGCKVIEERLKLIPKNEKGTVYVITRLVSTKAFIKEKFPPVKIDGKMVNRVEVMTLNYAVTGWHSNNPYDSLVSVHAIKESSPAFLQLAARMRHPLAYTWIPRP